MSHIKRAQLTIKELIEKDIENNANFKEQKNIQQVNAILKASSFALGSGKKLRSIITGSLCNFNNPGFVLFIEYVHNASLIVDDLPCMDNDSQRRGRNTVHVQYGEYTAQLTAYNLMITAMKHFSDGYYHIKSLYNENDTDWLYKHLNEEISQNLGYAGICGGQYIDLLLCKNVEMQHNSPRVQQDIVLNMIRMKTGCLFGLSMVLGWVASGGQIEAIDEIKNAGYSFGNCYQIIDDLQDIEKDVASNGGCNNVCKYFTHNEIVQLFIDNLSIFTETLHKYRCWNEVLKELYKYILTKFKSIAITH